jgi:7-carboxy-7-deazaguanine synthase
LSFCRGTGLEKDRHRAVCQFCDTEFVGTDGLNGGKYGTAIELAQKILETWKPLLNDSARPLVVCTGGEPLLQLDVTLVDELRRVGFEVAVETNGTLVPPNNVNWICVSPKAGSALVLKSGDELKLVYPQPGAEPEQFDDLDFKYFFLQPMDGPVQIRNTKLAIDYCLANPKWRLSLQTHKIIGIP